MPQYYQEIPSKKIIIFVQIVPLIIWSLLLYIFFELKKKGQVHFVIKALMIMPYIYTIISWKTFIYETVIPLEPEWNVCFSLTDPKSKNTSKNTPKNTPKNIIDNKIIASWNWKCGSDQQRRTYELMTDIDLGFYYMVYAFLLLGVLNTVFKHWSILDDIIIRFFSVIVLIFTLVASALTWANIYGVYSYLFIIRFISVTQSMTLSALLIIIYQFISYSGKY